MVARYYSNTAVATTLTAAISDSAITIPVTAVSGYPSTPFTGVIDPGLAGEELVEVTLVAGNNLTVERGIDGTPVAPHAEGAVFAHSVSARDFSEPQEHLALTTSVHGISNTANLVTLAGTQTLSNKTITGGTINGATLTTPTIASFANATHTHEDSASGGELGAGTFYGGGDYSAGSQSSSVSGYATISDLSLTFTAPSVWPDGATYMVYNFSFNLVSTTKTNRLNVRFRDGSTTIDPPGEIAAASVIDDSGFKSVSALGALPSAGSHTITVQFDSTASSWTMEKFHLWVYIV